MIVVGTNSWVTLAEANTYFSERIEADSWDSLPDDTAKEKYLISAYRWLFHYTGITAPATATDDTVKYGQCEAALFLIEFYDERRKRDALHSSGVKEFEKSKWSEELQQMTLPESIKHYFEYGGYYDGGCAAIVTVKDDNTYY